MTTPEKVKQIRDITMSSFGKINEALTATNGDVEKAIELLVKQKQADAGDMARRSADNNIVYSYVHNHRIGAMLVMGSQTDFVARNQIFLDLAKDICMHIVSCPTPPKSVDEMGFTKETLDEWKLQCAMGTEGKPAGVVDKIVMGKLNKKLDEVCLLRQKFIKDDSITIKDLIGKASATLGEKIEVKQFVRMIAS